MRVLTAILLLLASNFAWAGSITVSWGAPTENTDGTPLIDLAGYKLYYGTASGNYPGVIDVDNASVVTWAIENLPANTYYIVATAYNTAGIESVYSNEVVKTVPDDPKVPGPPTGLTVGADLTAYSVIKIENGFVLLAVGTVPAGTECDSAQSVNGHNAVDRDTVQMTQGGVAPYVVVADCT